MEESVIIDIKLNADDVAKQLSDVTQRVAELKREQKELTKEIAAGNDAYVSLLGLDTSSLTLFGFLIKNLLPVTIGNIIGGSIFVGITYWGCYRDRNKQ